MRHAHLVGVFQQGLLGVTQVFRSSNAAVKRERLHFFPACPQLTTERQGTFFRKSCQIAELIRRKELAEYRVTVFYVGRIKPQQLPDPVIPRTAAQQPACGKTKRSWPFPQPSLLHDFNIVLKQRITGEQFISAYSGKGDADSARMNRFGYDVGI